MRLKRLAIVLAATTAFLLVSAESCNPPPPPPPPPPTTTTTTVPPTTTTSTVPPTTTTTTAPSSTLFTDTFTRADGLITNEYAFWNPTLTNAVRSPDWEMTSGSLFVRNNQAWTGVPDSGVAPNNLSTNATDSAIFRLTSKRADFTNFRTSFDLTNNRLSTTAQTPAVDWDGVHIFLRYQTEESLYYASVNRRDGAVVLKKKCPGGPSNGGTYYDLPNTSGISYVSGHAIPFGVAQQVSASIKTNSNGSVTLSLARNGTTIQTATDSGVGCVPITHAGKTGIRGDNDDFTFDNFTVTAI